jgi:hypothetical protein
MLLPDHPYGITTHQSGHRTFAGVRVARNTRFNTLIVSCTIYVALARRFRVCFNPYDYLPSLRRHALAGKLFDRFLVLGKMG